MFRNLMNYAAKRPKPEDLVKKWKIVKGDTVQLIRGKDKGKKGVVTRVLRARNRLVVEGLNLVKKHVKPSEQNKGGVLTKEAPVHISNVALLDPQDGKPTKVKWGFLPAEQRNMGEFTKKGRVRLSRRSNSIIPRPVTLGQRKKPKPKDGPKDTAVADVLERTYVEPDYLPQVKKAREEKKARLEAKKKKRHAAIGRRISLIKKARRAKNADVRPENDDESGASAAAAPRAHKPKPAEKETGRGTPLGSIFSMRPQTAPPAAARAKMENVD